MGFDGFGSQVPGGGYTPKKNNKTGKWDRPVPRRKRSGGLFVALVTVIAWFVILSGAAILLWFLTSSGKV